MADLDATSSPLPDYDSELEALASVLKALAPLPDDSKTFVFRTAAERLGLSCGNIRRESSTRSESDQGNRSERSELTMTPKGFLRSKRPSSELQRMVCLAYYLTFVQEKPHFKTQDLTALNTDAAGGKFSNPSATVRNATSQSRFFAPGPKGTKQITSLGEDYVNALPDQDEAKTVVLSHKPRGTKRRTTVKE